MKKALALTAAALGITAESTWGHPGHGFDGTTQSAGHWLTSPDHLIAIVVLAVVIAMGLWVRARAARNRIDERA